MGDHGTEPEPQPDTKTQRVICGKTVVDWDQAVVYVHNKKNPHTLPTHLHFTFFGSGEYLLDEVAYLAGQWTHYPNKCLHTCTPGSHEYCRARQMAIRVVETYRRNYLKKHGMPPPAWMRTRSFDPQLLLEKTEQINQKVRDRLSGQLSLKF